MKSKTYVVAPHFEALNVGNPKMGIFVVAGIQKTKLFNVKGEKMNFSVITVFQKMANILKTKHTANLDSVIFGICTLRASI